MSRWGPAALASGVDLEGLKATLQRGARLLDLPQESLTVLTLTGDEHLREYNRRYRGLDEPTDVLAFAAREKASDQRFQAPPGTESWLGDIVISLPRARRQAKDAGHPIDDERIAGMDALPGGTYLASAHQRLSIGVGATGECGVEVLLWVQRGNHRRGTANMVRVRMREDERDE